jgi:hypothetical protein
MAKLPSCPVAFSVNGQTYFVSPGAEYAIKATRLVPDARAYNEQFGITPEQAFAMMNGLLYSWDHKFANPDTWVGKAIEINVYGEKSRRSNDE